MLILFLLLSVDALYPEYNIWEQYTTDSFGAAQKMDALRTSHPIIVPIKHAEEVEQVDRYDAIGRLDCLTSAYYLSYTQRSTRSF